MKDSLIFLGLVSLALSLGLTPMVRDLCRRFGIVDRPDVHRKLHGAPVPNAGGISLLLSFGGALGLWNLSATIFGYKVTAVLQQELPFIRLLLPSAALIFLTGLLDDLIGLNPWPKLIGQLLAAGAACWAGIRIHGFGGHLLPAWWSLPLTVVWLVLCSNAFNLIDGVDGVAAGVGSVAAVATLGAALLQNDFALALAAIALLGALLGFLRYNFNPASVFLGDSGSLPLGFLLGCYTVLWSQKSATLLQMTAPLVALAIPLLDTALAIGRRVLSGRSVFAADRGHIHHWLLARGLKPRQVALVFYALCSLTSLLSLWLTRR